MELPPQPPAERERLKDLLDLHVLDTPPDPFLDELTRVASDICGTPISLVTLIDADRQWFKSNHGLDKIPETDREIAFCSHTVAAGDLFVVEDAAEDERFADNPLVTQGPKVRFYAGVPLKTSEGHAIGTLCVIDREPRKLSVGQIDALRALSRQAIGLIDPKSATEAFLLIDPQERRTLYASPSFAYVWKRPRESVVNESIDKLLNVIHPGDLAPNLTAAGDTSARFRIVCPENETPWIEHHSFPVETPGGELRVAVTIRDVTSEIRKQQRSSSRQVEIDAFIAEVTPYAIFALDTEGRIATWNRGAERIKGYTAEEALGMPFAMLFSAVDVGEDLPRRLLERAGREGYVRHQGWRVRKDGTRFWADAGLTAVYDAAGRHAGYLKVTRDDTEKHRSDAALREALQQRERLLVLLHQAQESARKRIASNLHDDAVQMLTVLILQMDEAIARTEGPGERDLLMEMQTTARSVIDRLRTLMFDLVPPNLEHQGLASALGTYLDFLSDKTGADVSLTTDRMTTEPEYEVATTAFYITRELLINARKHAKASNIQVTLTSERGGTSIEVSDDGIGFDPDRDYVGHLGLLDARERAALAGGSLRIHSGPGEGTRADLWIPHRQRAEIASES